MATIYEVSKLAKVSLATVSRVMNNSGRVAEKTRKRVLAAMAELNYEATRSRATLALLERDFPMTALVCANDDMAAGALDAIRRSGRSIPEDISVVGFDNARWASFLYPKLTTVDYPVNEMSHMAAHWVLQHVYGDEDLEIRKHFEPKLINRASVRQLGNDV